MKIRVMVKFNSVKQSVESFGNGRYLVYLVSGDNDDANLELKGLLSKYLGTPTSRIEIVTGNNGNDKVLEVQ